MSSLAYEHGPALCISEDSIKYIWRGMFDMKRLRIIRELRGGRATGWGDPYELSKQDDFNKLPEGLRISLKMYFNGEDWRTVRV